VKRGGKKRWGGTEQERGPKEYRFWKRGKRPGEKSKELFPVKKEHRITGGGKGRGGSGEKRSSNPRDSKSLWEGGGGEAFFKDSTLEVQGGGTGDPCAGNP